MSKPTIAVVIGRYIVNDPKICHGKPTLRGTRFWSPTCWSKWPAECLGGSLSMFTLNISWSMCWYLS